MNPTKNSNGRNPGTGRGSSLSNGILFGGILLIAMVIGLVMVFKSTKSSPPAKEIQTTGVAVSEPMIPTQQKSTAPTLPIVRPEPVAVQAAPAVVEPISNAVPVVAASEPTVAVVDTNRNAK